MSLFARKENHSFPPIVSGNSKITQRLRSSLHFIKGTYIVFSFSEIGKMFEILRVIPP